MRRLLSVLVWAAGFVLVLALVAAGAAYAIVQTQTGHDFVLRMALMQAPNHLEGELRVGALRSDGLLRGFTLHDVSIRDDRGRPAVEVDSVRVHYSIRRLLGGDIALVPTELWRPRLVIETLHGDERSNLERVFRIGEADREERDAPSTVSLLLRRVALTGGSVIFRIPVDGEPPARGVTETVPGFEGLHQRLEFTEIEGFIREADILSPEAEGERIVFERLSLTGRIFEEPFVLTDLAGVITRVGSRLEVQADPLRLPGSELTGVIAVDWGDRDRGVVLAVDADVPSLDLADMRWLEPTLPDGHGRMALEVRGPLAESEWRIREADLRVGESRLRGSVGFDLAGGLRLAATDLDLMPLHLEALEPWLDEPLPIRGRLQGRVRATGPFHRLQLDAALAYDDPEQEIPSSTVRLAGTVEMGEEFVARGLAVEVDPLRYPTLRAIAPGLAFVGEGRASFELSGSLTSGFRLNGDLTHAPTGGGAVSRIVAAGSVREVEGGLYFDLEGDLEPLSFDGLALGLERPLPLRGEVTGRVRALGTLEDLAFDGDLSTAAGRVVVEGGLNALDPGAGYRARGRLEEFALHRILENAPDPTVLSGGFEVAGRGLRLDDLEGQGRLELTSILVAEAELDRLDIVFRAEDGRLLVDTVEARSPLGTVDGRGDLALRTDAPEGTMSFVWDAPSLARFRPLLGESDPIVADTLTELERQFLGLDGVDSDTIPGQVNAPLDGRAHGEMQLHGSVRDLEAAGFAELAEGAYRELSLGEGRIDFTAGWRGAEDWRAEATLGLDRFAFGRYLFEGGSGDVSYTAATRAGDAALRIQRSDREAYHLAGSFAVGEDAVDVDLSELVLDLDDMVWRLDEPASLRVEARTVQVDRLLLSRLASAGAAMAPAHMEVRGRLALDGDSDFRAEMRGVEIHRMAGLLQMEGAPEGVLDLDVAVEGPSDAPRMQGAFVVLDFNVAGTRLSRLEGTLDYRNLLASAELEAALDGRRLLMAEGRMPVDLSFRQVEDRFPDRNVDLTLSLDSLPAASALAFLDVVEGVEGVLDGRVSLRGTPRELRPSGEILLRGGAVSIPEQGLRITAIDGAFRVSEDRTVLISADGRARGAASVFGTISLEDLADPSFDLRIEAANFQAVDRRDLNARIGGAITLTGSYTRPHVGGRVRVEQGALFLEEIARTAEVVDLTDPAFFDVVDTMRVAARPVAVAAENPFLQNLRVDVDLLIQRDFWLRSREMSVEMDGELMVTFDRPRRELLLVGSLAAVRGSYTAFGRQFQVRSGNVEFVGTPGINPILDIEAVNRVRSEGGELLNVVASLEGTLESMQVGLSSDSQPPIAESDLISYLIFGRPSYALASGEVSVLEGAAGAGVGVGIGAIATQLGSVVASQFGVDYFTITQAREGGGLPTTAGLSGALAGTQIEMGQYVGQDLFLALTLRPLTGLGARAQNQFPGARLEWRFADLWTAEAFLEDRFAREAALGFGELGLRLDKVMGLSLYREWGY